MLPLRVAALVVLGIYGYASCLYGLAQFGVDLSRAFGPSDHSPRILARRVAWSATRLAAIVVVASLAHVLLVQRIGDILSWAGFFAVVAHLFAVPQFRRLFRRIAVGGLSVDHRLGDVLISDCMVSYASVLTDLALGISLTWTGQQLDRAQNAHPFVLLTASLPIGIRMKQCFIDFRRTRQKQHLFNLLKYLVSNIPNSLRIQMLHNPALSAYIPYALTVSALYSLFWDLKYDWNLSVGMNRPHKFPVWSYYAAASIDACLRFAWVFHKPSEYRIFSLQVLELLRRWMWVFFRVESEPQGMDDIELPSMN